MANENYFYDTLSKEEQERVTYRPTICEFLAFIGEEYADRPALGNSDVTYTYKELVSRVARRRQYINQLGFEPGAKIGVMARTSIDAMELFLAITTAGYTVIMLPTALNDDALFAVSKKFAIAGLFIADEFLAFTDKLDINTYKMTSIADEEAPMAEVQKQTVAAIYFTGGTTGAPKGVVLNHGALMRGSHNGIFQPGQVFYSRYISFLPLSHIFGSVRGFLSCLYTGSFIYACEDMKAAVGLIPVVRPTALVIVPGLAEIILGIAKMKGAAFLGDLKTLIVGAAPVPPRLMAQFREFNIALLAGYGLTEGSNLSSGNYDTDVKPDSMGKIYPGQDYKVVDGELWIKGDNLMDGYYEAPEATAEVMEDGWLKTGDLVEFDEEGYVYIVGRIKNLIILSNGENVSPEEIEEAFYKQSLVKDCLVKEDDLNGERVIAIEILPFAPMVEGLSPEEIKVKIDAMVAEVNAKMPTFKRVMKVTVRDTDFKRTGAMKIARN